MSKHYLLLVAALGLTYLVDCKQSPERTDKAAEPAKTLPADAKTIALFRSSNPKQGDHAKIHGFVGSTNGNAWPLVDKVGDTLPFVFCKMASPPGGVEKQAHVVAEGKVEDDAMLVDCTISAL